MKSILTNNKTQTHTDKTIFNKKRTISLKLVNKFKQILNIRCS